MAHVKIPHKHSELIKAKADNMDLVVFVKVDEEWRETKSCNDAMMFFEGKHYFLCLPQHKEVCLHWLNGGDVQLQAFPTNPFIDYIVPLSSWSHELWWMSEQCNIRIKPRKEKRWIAVKRNDKTEVYTVTFDYLDEAADTLNEKYWQFIEIEVEV